MYSKIPMPRFEWKDDDMSHSLTFFPLVGAVIGALVCVLNSISPFCTLPALVRILVTVLIPLIITGGFHVDGFMDTEDAMNSYAPIEKKLEILKDSHIGAFAVIALVKWLLAYTAAVAAILLNEKCDLRVCTVLGLTFAISRSLSGLTSLLLEKAKKTGMLFEETKNRERGTVIALVIQLIIACIAAICMNLVAGVAMIAAALLYTAYYRNKVYKEFGGVTGDTAGFFLITVEVFSTIVLALTLYLY